MAALPEFQASHLVLLPHPFGAPLPGADAAFLVDKGFLGALGAASIAEGPSASSQMKSQNYRIADWKEPQGSSGPTFLGKSPV